MKLGQHHFFCLFTFVTLLSTNTVAANTAVPCAPPFPFKAGNFCWSASLGFPSDGREDPGFTNGCVRLGSNRRAILGSDKGVKFDPSMCGVLPSGEVAVASSEAADACERIDGRLPSKENFEALIRSFKLNVEYSETKNGPRLEYAGVLKLAKVFDEDVSDLRLWTSTVVKDFPEYAFGFDAGLGLIGNDAREVLYYNSVRCIRK